MGRLTWQGQDLEVYLRVIGSCVGFVRQVEHQNKKGKRDWRARSLCDHVRDSPDSKIQSVCG